MRPAALLAVIELVPGLNVTRIPRVKIHRLFVHCVIPAFSVAFAVGLAPIARVSDSKLSVGFKLVAEGDFWRHPEDPRDFSIQPPSGRAVDEFVLKFQK